MPVPPKDKMERVKESVHLLRQLKDIGFQDTSKGYLDIKEVLDRWIADGVSWSGKIKLPEYGRVADIVLPGRAGAVANLRLRAV